MSGSDTKRRLGDIDEDRTDWHRVDKQTDADVARAIAADSDTFEPDES